MTHLAPDIEGALKAWLPTRSSLSSLGITKVFFGVPRIDPPDKLIVVTLISGAWRPGSHAPIYRGMVQIDCWATTKADAFAMKAAVEGELFGLAAGTQLTSTIGALGAEIVSSFFAPDPADDNPRYVVSAEISVIKTS